MKSQTLHTGWCNISGEAAGEIWNWSLLGVKGLDSRVSSANSTRLDWISVPLVKIWRSTETVKRFKTTGRSSENETLFHWPYANTLDVMRHAISNFAIMTRDTMLHPPNMQSLSWWKSPAQGLVSWSLNSSMNRCLSCMAFLTVGAS